MDKKIFDLTLRALVYMEDGLYHARCIDMDLLGVGKSEKIALQNLTEMISEHISFALFKNDESLILFPSDSEYLTRWEEAQRFKLHNELFPDKAVQLNGKAVFISFTKDELAQLRKPHPFNTVPALA